MTIAAEQAKRVGEMLYPDVMWFEGAKKPSWAPYDREGVADYDVTDPRECWAMARYIAKVARNKGAVDTTLLVELFEALCTDDPAALVALMLAVADD